MPSDSSVSADDTPDPLPMTRLQKLDAWMAESPWHPRLVPFFAYLLLLLPVQWTTANAPAALPFAAGVQIAVITALLVRYRKLTPELNLAFHWTVLPSIALLIVAWVGLGQLMVASNLPVLSNTLEGPHRFEIIREDSEAMFWLAMSLRFVSMVLLVPFFEELFVRSAMLRSLHSPRKTGMGLLQILVDLPLIGDWLSTTTPGKKALAAKPLLTEQLETVPLRSVTVFAVAASTLVFMLSHAPRDWPGCIACGIVWCVMVAMSNRSPSTQPTDTSNTPSLPGANLPASQPTPGGLGPVIWSHAGVNAALWAYTLYTGDWQFL
ncbi:MAG: hypothetical protein AAF750_12490 [Planctomycetota bacterium]